MPKPLLGHKLFRSTPNTCPISFIPGDIFNHDFITPAPPANTSSEAITYPTLATLDLSSLNPLRHKISVVHSSSFFHLFNEADQLTVAHRLASLLSPEPGSIIFGSHRGREGEGGYEDRKKHFHNPESWNKMWDEVFQKGTVKCESFIHNPRQLLIWSVTRLWSLFVRVLRRWATVGGSGFTLEYASVSGRRAGV